MKRPSPGGSLRVGTVPIISISPWAAGEASARLPFPHPCSLLSSAPSLTPPGACLPPTVLQTRWGHRVNTRPHGLHRRGSERVRRALSVLSHSPSPRLAGWDVAAGTQIQPRGERAFPSAPAANRLSSPGPLPSLRRACGQARVGAPGEES